jgi:DNA-directed RNA polymerase specialized sigma24 family protein
MSQTDGGEPERFPSTHWSLVAEAGQDDALGKRDAIGRLLVRYMPALRAHLIFGKRLDQDKADDLLQEFIANKILERDLLVQADRQLGKFRTFLLTTLNRFVLNQIRGERARKRTPDAGAYTAGDDWARQLPCRQDPTDVFDIAWARGVIDQAVGQMQAECEKSGRKDIWGVFECRILQPALEGTEPLDYRRLIERFGFRSPNEASNVLVTAKRMYARILRDVVGQYARNTEEIDAEIKELHGILANSKA